MVVPCYNSLHKLNYDILVVRIWEMSSPFLNMLYRCANICTAEEEYGNIFHGFLWDSLSQLKDGSTRKSSALFLMTIYFLYYVSSTRWAHVNSRMTTLSVILWGASWIGMMAIMLIDYTNLSSSQIWTQIENVGGELERRIKWYGNHSESKLVKELVFFKLNEKNATRSHIRACTKHSNDGFGYNCFSWRVK